jgi:hypothetical protein
MIAMTEKYEKVGRTKNFKFVGYHSQCGMTMRREGPLLNWHLRDAKGNLIDHDNFRNDLAERNHIVLHHG